MLNFMWRENVPRIKFNIPPIQQIFILKTIKMHDNLFEAHLTELSFYYYRVGTKITDLS